MLRRIGKENPRHREPRNFGAKQSLWMLGDCLPALLFTGQAGFVASLLAMTALAAGNIVFEATVDRNVVALGENIQLSLTFQGATDAPAPQIQEPEGFSAKYLGPSTMMSIVNGKMSSSISHNYILIPLKAGKFTLGPFSAEYQGQKYMSQAIEVEVVDQPAQQPAKQREDITAEEQLKDRIFVELDAGKRDIYLNEIVPVTARLYVNKLAIRDIEYPVIAADGFSKEKFGQPNQYQKALAGLVYDVIEFSTCAYSLKTGALTLGPAEIKCNLVTRRQPKRRSSGPSFDDFFPDNDFFSDFFDRYQTYPLDLKSTELSINVKSLPEANKPADFTGAIGEFDLEASADPLNVKVGDPISLKMTISGMGNFAAVNAPALEDAKDFKVYPPANLPMRLSETIGGGVNQKVFEQVIMPMSENVNRIPVISFSFFDPKAQTYQTVKRGPFAITVSKSEGGSEQIAKPKLIEKEEILGKDIVYIKDSPGIIIKKGKSLYRNSLFIWIFILPLVLFSALFVIESRNQRMRTDTRFARMQKAYKNARKKLDTAHGFMDKDKKEEFYSAVFKALQDYIGDRLHISSGGITALSAEQILRTKGAAEDILNKIKEVFDACDAARFAASAVTKDDMLRAFQLAKEIVEGLEKVRL